MTSRDNLDPIMVRLVSMIDPTYLTSTGIVKFYWKILLCPADMILHMLTKVCVLMTKVMTKETMYELPYALSHFLETPSHRSCPPTKQIPLSNLKIDPCTGKHW